MRKTRIAALLTETNFLGEGASCDKSVLSKAEMKTDELMATG